MVTTRGGNAWWVLLALAGSVAAAQAAEPYRYQDLPASPAFPAPEFALQASVLSGDQAAVRAHAWHLWAGLTARTDTVVDGQRVPVFETWYSIDEVYNPRGRAGLEGRTLRHVLRVPTQRAVAGVRPDGHAGTMSFVKLNRRAADFIWDNGYHLRPTLDALQARFAREGTPTIERTIKPFPPDAMALKVVYWLVKGGASPQSERGLTGLPVWDPAYPPPAGGQPPMHTTWRGGVAVDPDGRYPEGSAQPVSINGTADRPNVVLAPVVSLRRFHAQRLTSPEDVADAKTFMNEMSSAAGEQERLVTNAGQTPEIGDYLVLLGMHVTSKELDDWTFQTFWWMPAPNAAPFGHDRPATVRAPFDHYLMCTAYSQVSPKGPDGAPPVCFNPYLETDLGATKPYTMDGTTWPADPMAGTRSNCQNCHRRAAYPAFDPKYPGAADLGHVYNDGYRAGSEPYYDRLLKTDFLWSIPLKSVPP